jgi:hypothetical protein
LDFRRQILIIPERLGGFGAGLGLALRLVPLR